MSAEEQRLAELLKHIVPDPPAELSADQITGLRAERSRRAWAVPALAAAATLVAGVAVGAIAAHHAHPGTPPAPVEVGSSATRAVASPSASPRGPVAHADGTAVPNVVGQPQAQAVAVLQTVGFKVVVRAESDGHLPAGVVIAQFPAAGAAAPPGTRIELTVAAA